MRYGLHRHQQQAPPIGILAGVVGTTLLMLQLEFASAGTIVVGPNFDGKTSQLDVAADDHLLISGMVRARLFAEDSPFVQATLAQLLEFLERPHRESQTGSDPRPPLSKMPRPRVL